MLTDQLKEERFKIIAHNPPMLVYLTPYNKLDGQDHLEQLKKTGVVDGGERAFLFHRFVKSCNVIN